MPLSLGVRTRGGLCFQVAFGRAGNQARAAAKRQILESPLHKDEHATLELDDIHQVNEQPDEPRRPAPKMKAKNISNRGGAADDRHVTFVEVTERRQILLPF